MEVFFVRVVLIFNVQISRYSHCFTVPDIQTGKAHLRKRGSPLPEPTAVKKRATKIKAWRLC